jgi:hypothetical protein
MANTRTIRNCKFNWTPVAQVKVGDMVWWSDSFFSPKFALIVKITYVGPSIIIFGLKENGICENCRYESYQSIDVMIDNET